MAAALNHLSKLQRRPVNRLVTDAVKAYLDRHVPTAERDLEARLTKLRAYRQHDPDFDRAIAAFAEAEVHVDDPAEGSRVERTASVRRDIRQLLNG
jgi:hypothetical protein